ncbi:ExeM/NucH family extracellular endonuclease [Cryobacterium sp. CG_9.6]|uniref:ExeM/NucH family extracellular endonuclease n=1 Tax=Cryobacterium sp. CG_9.6 TaxID=2760710 RepID=UPI0024768AF7|nr:ExeM/NucH family extracellular endonuclease [Cryobacterium sp. CG_9.6]MDH6238295.1 putative extracellular nuclease [Cryobacterium sp. CG_9.6]
MLPISTATSADTVARWRAVLVLLLAGSLGCGIGVVVATRAPGASGADSGTAVPIAAVQGTADQSSLVGSTVTVEGVLTADLRAGGYAGVFLQTAGSGGATHPLSGASDAIFVHLGSATPSVTRGDLVRATGQVSEYDGLTQITASASGATARVAAGVALPEATPLPDTLIGSARESLEGMLVAPDGTYRVSDSHELDQFGALWLSAGTDAAVHGTERARPGSEAAAVTSMNEDRRLILDDGRSERFGTSSPGTATPTAGQPYIVGSEVVRVGDTVMWPAEPWVLSYGFGDWRLQPTGVFGGTRPTFTTTNPRPVTPPAVGGTLRAATFNVQNYFTTRSSNNPRARGAATAAEFAVQKSKIVAAITGLGADVVCLLEIENSLALGGPVDTAVADLVSALNTAAGRHLWDFVPTPEALRDPTATDVITTALIYTADALTPVGPSRTTPPGPVGSAVSAANTRAPIAQAFRTTDRTFTVVGSHFKSKGGDGAEPADGQGRFTEVRVAQARALTAFVPELQASSGSPDVLLLGDFNSYAEEDPVTTLTATGLVDLVPTFSPGQYTYVFDGEVGSLDHAFATPSLAEHITGAAVWAINSAEWSGRGYAGATAEPGSPFRSSDHDPILVGVAP